jgi:ribosomal protein L35
MLKYFVQRNLKFSNFSSLPKNTSLTSTFNKTSNFLSGGDLIKKYFFTRMFTMSANYNMNKLSLPLPSTISNQLIKYQKFNMRSMKSKRKLRAANTKYRITNHSGLMKRIRVVGPRWNRQFKFYPTGNVHKMTNKSSGNLRRKRKPRLISAADIRRVKRLIPYFKRKKCKH